MTRSTLVLTVLFLARCSSTVFAQTLPIYKDPTQPIDRRVSDLLSKMTPEEKFWQLFMIPGDIPAGEEKNTTTASSVSRSAPYQKKTMSMGKY